MERESILSQEILKWTYGLVPIVAGLDKFTNLLVDWTKYISPMARAIIPFTPALLMSAVGAIEVAAGLLVLSKFTRFGSAVVSAWLLLIALTLITGGFYDIAVRDIVMSVGALVLYELSTARARQNSRSAEPRTTSSQVKAYG